MLIGIFNAMVLRYYRSGRLFAYARNPRNIVGGITHKCLHVYKFYRRNSVGLNNLCRIVVLNLRSPLLCLRYTDLYIVRGKL